MQVPSAIDFSGLGDAIVKALVDGIRQVLTPLPIEFENWLLHSVQGVLSAQGAHNLLTHIPQEWTSQNSDVLNLWRQGLLVETGLAAVVIAIQGYRVANGRAELLEVLFRTGFLIVLGEGMAFWSDQVLHVVNLASDAVGSSALDIRQENLPNDLVLGFMLIAAALFAVFAWIKGAVGVVFIQVLIASAPYLLTLSALPFLEGLGTWWAKEFTTWTLRPFMVALVLRLGLGVGLVNTGGLQLLFAIVAFWLAYTMDTRMRSFSVGAWGSIGTLGLFGRGARLASGAFGGGAAAVPAGAAAAATP